MKHSPLYSHLLESPLANSSILLGKTKNHKKSIMATLLLTSLVDAFSIMLIYLIVNTQNSNTIDVPQGLQLPRAAFSDSLNEPKTMVRIEHGKYFLNNQEIAIQNLVSTLNQIKTQKNIPGILVVQADQNTDYKDLNPLLLSGSVSGFTQFQFVVLQNENNL